MLRTVSGKGFLRYRAGERAFRRIREEGFGPGSVRVVVGPASGPKWLVLAGIDRALLGSGLLEKAAQGGRVLLVGSSAGAWRALALASRDPAKTHLELEQGYVHHVFPRGVTPGQVSEVYRDMLARVFSQDDIRHALDHPHVDLAIHVARTRGLAGSRRRRIQGAALLLAAALNALTPRTMALSFQRVLLHSRPERWSLPFRGLICPLVAEGVLGSALATGTVPLYMKPTEAPPGAPPGRYIDGGLTDYHLNQAYAEPGQGVILFPHFQRRIVPNWFDRYLPRRRPGSEAVADVLQVYPSSDFVRGLPGGRIPVRDDFLTWVDEPKRRIRRWQEASRQSDRLGEELVEDLERGRIPELLEPLGEEPGSGNFSATGEL